MTTTHEAERGEAGPVPPPRGASASRHLDFLIALVLVCLVAPGRLAAGDAPHWLPPTYNLSNLQLYRKQCGLSTPPPARSRSTRLPGPSRGSLRLEHGLAEAEEQPLGHAAQAGREPAPAVEAAAAQQRRP